MQCTLNADRKDAATSSASNDEEAQIDNISAMKVANRVFMILEFLRLDLGNAPSGIIVDSCYACVFQSIAIVTRTRGEWDAPKNDRKTGRPRRRSHLPIPFSTRRFRSKNSMPFLRTVPVAKMSASRWFQGGENPTISEIAAASPQCSVTDRRIGKTVRVSGKQILTSVG